MNQPNALDGTDEFVITCALDAPREQVFKAWTERERLIHWWGPKGFTLNDCAIDLRPDGAFVYSMQLPDGEGMWGKWVFREIAAPDRLVFVVSFSDAEGNPTHHPFNPDWPMEILSTVSFIEHEGKTQLTLHWTPINASEKERQTFAACHEAMQQGWSGTFEQLAEHLAERN